ncbi:MAG: hypothetical protein KatS3mg104_3026 [Phycisphaerae bacterium]|nr:MAG: hypothetical protein KatS3mg104_3026 [Phycisphaerae bacterium]
MSLKKIHRRDLEVFLRDHTPGDYHVMLYSHYELVVSVVAESDDYNFRKETIIYPMSNIPDGSNWVHFTTSKILRHPISVNSTELPKIFLSVSPTDYWEDVDVILDGDNRKLWQFSHLIP